MGIFHPGGLGGPGGWIGGHQERLTVALMAEQKAFQTVDVDWKIYKPGFHDQSRPGKAVQIPQAIVAIPPTLVLEPAGHDFPHHSSSLGG